MTALFASGADVNVDFDLSVVAQIALFALFITVLKPVLFDPLLRLFEERERRTDGARADARKMDEKAAELLARFEAEIELVRREAAAEREKLRLETRELENRVLEEAKRDSARILEQGRERIRQEVATLRKDLDASRPALAAEIAGKLLGREVQS
jgi:F-type H+-transporting ATPase subunit b